MSQSKSVVENKGEPYLANRLWMAVLLGALSAFGPLSIDMYLPALPHIAKALHTVPALVQLSLTFCLLGLSLGQLIIGPLSDIHGRRKPLLIGLIVYFVASILCALTQSVGLFILLRFIQGLSGAAGIVLSRAIARDLNSGTNLTKFFALLSLVNGAAPILAPIIGGQLLRIAPWQGVFLVLSFIGLLMFFIVLFCLKETLSDEARLSGNVGSTLGSFKTLLVDRRFVGYALAQGMVSASLFAYISGSSFVFQIIYGVSPQTYSLIFACNGLGIICLSQLTGKLSGKLHEGKLFIVGLGLSLVGAAALLVSLLLNAGLAAILITLFIVVSSIGIVNTSGFSLALQNYGKQAGSASALLGVLMFVLGGCASPLVGLGKNQAVSMGVVIFFASLLATFVYIAFVARKSARSDFKK